MIAVAVVGILAAVALPSYQEYIVRGKVAEGLSLASGAKVAVATAYQDSRGLPVDNAAADLPRPETIRGQYVGSVAVVDGDIHVTFNDAVSQLAGRSLILAASADGGAIDWCCYSPNIAPRFLPANCRDSAACGVDAAASGDGASSGSGESDTGVGTGSDSGTGS
ncbi:pilin, partial [Thiococcus pfennigii]